MYGQRISLLRKDANNKGAQAAYRMVYTGEADNSHDYSEDFALGIWSEVAWSKSMDSNSGTGTFKLAHKQDAAGNYYMQAGTDNQGGERGSRLELNSEIIKGSKVSFDWMPISAASNSCGDLMFLEAGTLTLHCVFPRIARLLTLQSVL